MPNTALNIEQTRQAITTYGDTLLADLMYGFKTAQYVNTIEGIIGSHTETELQFLDDITRRGRIGFHPIPTSKLTPRTLTPEWAKIDLLFAPAKLRSSYMRWFKSAGVKPYELTFEVYVIIHHLLKLNKEQEIAVWRGEKAEIPTNDDKLNQMIDGFHAILRKGQENGDITPVVTGALTEENCFDAVDLVLDKTSLEMFQGLDKIAVHMAPSDIRKYQKSYKARFKGNKADVVNGRVQLDEGNVELVGLPGIKPNSILVTPAENLSIGFEDRTEEKAFRVEERHRGVELELDFGMGTQVWLLNDTMVTTNDQH